MQETAQVQQAAAGAAASLHLAAADLVTLVDKSLPTALGLAGGQSTLGNRAALVLLSKLL